MTIKTRPLGRSGLNVTALGLGGAPLGDLYEKLPEEQASATVAAALAQGVKLFDTAPLYGYGLSEHRMGHVLRQHPRDSYVLSTKVGRYLEPEAPAKIDRGQWAGGLNMRFVVDYTYDGTMRALEQSYQRLGVERIDIVLIHDLDIWTYGTREAYEEHLKTAIGGALKALTKLRDAGTIKAIGIGVNEIEPCLRMMDAGDLNCLMLAGRYTLLEQEPLDTLLPQTEKRGVGILLAGPYNSGILATGAVPGAKYNYNDAPPEIMAKVQKIQEVCARYDVPLAAAAVQFPLGHASVSCIVTGAVKPEEIERNRALISTPIPADLWADLKREGLLRADAPVPASA